MSSDNATSSGKYSRKKPCSKRTLKHARGNGTMDGDSSPTKEGFERGQTAEVGYNRLDSESSPFLLLDYAAPYEFVHIFLFVCAVRVSLPGSTQADADQ